MRLLLPFGVALLVAMALVPWLVRAAHRLALVDAPGERKVHALPIPRVGGLAMAAGVMAALGAAAMVTPAALLGPTERAFLAGALVLLVAGVVDDRYDLDYRYKLLGQLVAAAIAVAGGVLITGLTLQDRVELPFAASVVLTVAFLVGVTNAINLSDGLDGLAGGLVVLCLSAVALFAHHAGREPTLVLALAFLGAVLGFLRHNTHPAIVFMGDAGSQVLGYAVAALCVLATQQESTSFSAALPLLLLGVPVLDTASVIVRRLAAGRSPFAADRNHLHHRLLALGLSHRDSVTFLYGAQSVLFLAAYVLRFESDLVILLAYGAFSALLLVPLAVAERWPRRKPAVYATAEPAPPAPDVRPAPRWPLQLVGTALGGYLVLVVVEARLLANDLRWMVLAVALSLLALAGLRDGRHRPVITRGLLYLGATTLVLVEAGTTGTRLVPYADLVLPALVATGTVALIQARAAPLFVPTPLDVLALFLLVVVPSLAGLAALNGSDALTVAKIAVLLYATEALLSAGDRVAAAVHWAVTAALLWLALAFHPF